MTTPLDRASEDVYRLTGKLLELSDIHSDECKFYSRLLEKAHETLGSLLLQSQQPAPGN